METANYSASFEEEDGKAVLTRFRFGPNTCAPEDAARWMIRHANGPAMQTVLRFLQTEVEGKEWKTDVDDPLEKFRHNVKGSLGRGFARPSIRGSVHLSKMTGSKGKMHLYGHVVFDPEACRWKKFLDRTKDLKRLKAFESGDGAHRGIFDLYEPKKKSVKRAIAGGKAFTTGNFGSKHEIVTGRFTTDGEGMHCAEAWVSNDYDTKGLGTEISEEPLTYELVEQMLSNAHAKACVHQAGCAQVAVYKLLDKDRKWIETYLSPHNDCDFEEPPGEYAEAWGWQNETEDLPKGIREWFEGQIRLGNIKPEKAEYIRGYKMEVSFG